MAESAVNILLNQLALLIREERQLLGRLDEKVQYIKDQLELMLAFLRVADAKEDRDPQLQAWVRQVRELAYDAQDVLDLFMLRFARVPAGGFPARVEKIYVTMKNYRTRRNVASDLRKMESRLKRIQEGHLAFQIKYGDTQVHGSSSYAVNSKLDRRADALLVDEAMLVGIDGPKEKLIDQLLDGDTQLKAVSVIGMGGLGKTTLVKRIYEDERIKWQFQCHAWVTISQSFNIEELLKSLIRQLHAETNEALPQNVEFPDGHDLKECVKDFLRAKRYVIVFDDIWNIDSWDTLKYALPDSNKGSRVLLTTRIRDVAYATRAEYFGYVYEMGALSKEDSWTLFCRKTFQDKICPPHLKDVSERILIKSEGLPLAILAIGGLLSLKDKDSIREWEMVCNSLDSELYGDHGKLERVKEVIMLSYYDLPYYLKPCLLYFSIFPEDQTIEHDYIIQLWNSEGLLESRENMTREEVGAFYMNELISRSLVQGVEVIRDRGNLIMYRIHDIVHEIIVSMSRKQHFVNTVSTRDSALPAKVRRFVVHGSMDNFDALEMSSFRKLRSLLFVGSKNYKVSTSEQFINNLAASGDRLLKVLSLPGAPLIQIPKEVFKLYFLTHLDLSWTEVEAIPKSVGKLVHLETLNLSGTNVTELPIQILKLQRLRHLLVYKVLVSLLTGFRGDLFFKAPYHIGCLSSLQTLGNIEVDHAMGDTSMVREIGRLTQLTRLGIGKLRREDGKDLCSSLENWSRLRRLAVTSTGPDEILDLIYPLSPLPQFLQQLHLCGRLEKMPQWISCLRELTRVELLCSRLSDDPLEFFEELPNLKVVHLRDAFEGTTLHFKAGKFPSLKELFLKDLRGLRSLIIDEYSMPRLDELRIDYCSLMVELPIGLEHLTKLERFVIHGMNEMFLEAIANAKSSEERPARLPIFLLLDL